MSSNSRGSSASSAAWLVVLVLWFLGCWLARCAHVLSTDEQLRSQLGRNAIELNLLKMLNISSFQKGVGKTTGPIASLPAWKLFSGFNTVQLSLEPEQMFRNSLSSSGALSAIFVAKPNRHSVATLFSIHLPGKMSPLMRVAINFRTRRFVLSYTIPDSDSSAKFSTAKVEPYGFDVGSRHGNSRATDDAEDGEQAADGFQLNSVDVRNVKFKLASSRSSKKKKVLNWTWVGVTVTPKEVTLYENCEEPITVELEESPLLRLPSDSLVYFRQEPGLKRKFVVR